MKNNNTWWAVVKYLSATSTRGARWSVRVGKARWVVPYDHALSGLDRVASASRDCVAEVAGDGWALSVVDSAYIDSLGVYVCVWRGVSA